jgi:hypothetical protein
MATSLNSMLGDFRGSVNGVCGSRNAAKAYIRARVKPTNPKSDAQKAARAAFRSAGKYFKTLSDTQRAQWQGFALDGYNPLKKSNSGQYTAAQVLTGIMASVNSSNVLFQTPVVTAFGTPGTLLTLSSNLMSIDVNAPIFSIAPVVQDTVAGPASFNCLGAWLETSGTLTLDFAFEGLASSGLGQGLLLDSNNLRFGFGCYISNSVNYANQRPKSIMQSNLGFTGIIDLTAPGLLAEHGIRVTMDVSSQLLRYKSHPLANQWFKITPILIGENGTQTKLNTVNMQFGVVAPTIPT